MVTYGSCLHGQPKVTLLENDTLKFTPISQSLLNESHSSRLFFAPTPMGQRDIVNSLRRSLSQGKPIPCGVAIDNKFRKGSHFSNVVLPAGQGLPERTKKCLWHKNEGPVVGYHAMIIVGYNDDVKAFEVLNSMGEDFGDNGAVWISYDFISDLGDDKQKREDNPCLIVAWDYISSLPQSSFANRKKKFHQGNLGAWVRLKDVQGGINFNAINNDSLELNTIEQGDTLIANKVMIIREGYNTRANQLTTTTPQISTIEKGVKVKIEDIAEIQSHKGTKELWGKVKMSE